MIINSTSQIEISLHSVVGGGVLYMSSKLMIHIETSDR